MSTYKLTPQQRKARAQALAAQRRAVAQNRAKTGAYKTQSTDTAQRNNTNAVLRTAATAADLTANVIKGALKGLEGIHDFTTGLGLNYLGMGVLGSLLTNGIVSLASDGSDNYGEKLKNYIEYDFVGEGLGFNKLDELLNESSYVEEWGKAGQITEAVLQGVGQMLPSVAVTVATAGAGAPAAVSQAAALATTGVSAAGTATEEAYQEGAGYGEGLLYGTAVGGMEAATEKLTGGISVFGKGMLDNVGKSIVKEGAEGAVKAGAKVGAQRVIKDMAGEAAEEAIAELANPALKSIYKGKDAFAEYGESDYWAGVGEAALVGGLTSAVYGGTLGKVKKLGGSSSIESDAREVAEDIDARKKQIRKLSANGKLTQEQAVNAQKVIKADMELLEKQMQKASPKARAKALESGLGVNFDENGNLRPEIRERLDKNIQAASDTTYDYRYRSVDLDADTISKNLEHAGVNAFTGELDADQDANYKEFKRLFNAMSDKSGSSMSFILGDENMADNGLWIDGDNIMVLSAATLRNGEASTELAKKVLRDSVRGTTVHEGWHAIDGTASADELKEHLRSNDGVYKEAIEKYLDRGYSREYFESIKAEGNERIDALIDIIEKSGNDNSMTDAEARVLKEFEEEWPAFASQQVLDTEDFARKLIKDDLGAVEKLLSAIQDLKKTLSNRKNADAKKAEVFVKKTEQLYLNALEEIGAKYINGKIAMAERDKEDENTTNTNNIKHSFLGYAEDGRGIYSSSFPKGTPKAAKSQQILEYITKVWSKKPISLLISNGETSRSIKAHFDPTVDSSQNIPSDASKIAGGNRHGNHTEQRVTLDLADDYYQILSESKYNYSKLETGKTSITHSDVKMWHYFVNDIYFIEAGENDLVPYTVTINIKEKNNGDFVYSFNAEKESPTRRTLHAGVNTYKGANGELFFDNSIPQTEEKSTLSDKKSFSNVKRSRTAAVSTDQKDKITDEDRNTGLALAEFIENVNSMFDKSKKSKRMKKIGIISKNHADIITKLMKSINPSFSADGYELWIDGTGAQHIEIRHGKNGKADNSMASNENKSLIPWAVQNADNGEFIKTDEGEIKKSDRFYNSDGTRAPEIRLSKNMSEGKIYISECVPDSTNKIIWITSAYINKKGSNGQLLNMEDNSSPQPTPEASFDGTATNNSISQTEEKSTPSDKKSSSNVKHSRTATANFDLFDGTAARKVTMTEGEVAKFKANYHGMKQFNRVDVETAFGKVDALNILTKKQRKNLVSHVFKGYNEHLDAQGYQLFSQVMYDKIHSLVLKNSEFQMSREDVELMDSQLLNALNEIVESGHDSIKAKLEYSVSQEGLKKQADFWRNEHQRATEQIKIRGRILSLAQKIKDLKTGAYVNASRYMPDIFKGSIEKLARIQFRGNMNVTGTRDIIKDLNEWYDDTQNALYSRTDPNSGVAGRFNNDVKTMMNDVANGEGAFTTNELLSIEKIVSYFVGEIETYNTVLRNGQRVEAKPLAESYIDKAKKAREIQLKCSAIRAISRNRYAIMVADPATLMRQADGYMNGFFTEMFEEMRQGEITSAVNEMELTQEFREFWDKNKAYRKHYNEGKIEVNGHQIPVGTAISLYMTYQRKHAQAGLILSGFDILDGEKKVTVYRGTNEKLTQKQIQEQAKKRADELYAKFSEGDKKFISIMERAFEGCRKIKIDVDMALQHFTNVDNNDYYFPIRRSQIAQNVDMFSMFEGDRVSNLSMNKDTVKGAKNALLIEPAHLVFMRHVKATSLYSGLGIFTDNFNRLFNLNVNSNFNRPETIKSTLEADKFPKAMIDYFTEIKKDIEGISTKEQSTQFFNDAVRIIRSTYAKYQLGANPKVWFTQLSSFFASTNILDYSSIVKGFGMKNKKEDVDKYCKLAWLRNVDNSAVKAQAVTDKIGKIGDFLMRPIGRVDRGVVISLFGACQVQVARDQKLAVGTEENKKAAGELLQKVILETQQNSLASERSAAMRTNNDLLKSFTMFSADAMKVFSRFIDAFGEREVLRSLIKNEKDPKVKAEYEARLKQVNKQCKKGVSALVATSFFTSLIALLSKWWYRRDEEEDFGTFTADVVGNMIGGLPIIRDVYSFFADGYEMQNFMASTFNDVLSASLDSVTLLSDAASGKDVTEQEVASAIRKLFYAAGQMTGIPVRNAYNFVTGNINRFSPSTGYKIESAFYKQTYSADLAKAIENEDEDMIATIAGLMLNENVGGIESEAARTELNRLVTEGYDVIPRGVSDTVTYDGETYELTSREKKEFSKIYNIANESLADMVKLARYKEATDEVKQKAIAFVYDVYYKLALQDFLGEDLETKTVLFAEAIDIEKLALIVATARSLTADTDKDGKTVSGSRKKKVLAYINSLRLTAAEKYMVAGYLGYKNVKGEAQVKAHINTLNLTKSEKSKLLEYSGYTVE